MSQQPTPCQRRLLRSIRRGVGYSPFAGTPGAKLFPRWTRRINLQPTISAMTDKGLLRLERVHQQLNIRFGQMHVTGRSWPIYFKT